MSNLSEKLIPKALSALHVHSEGSQITDQQALSLTSRAVFLLNALLISDFSSSARFQKLLPLILPGCYNGLRSDYLDLRENSQHIVTTLLMSLAGREAVLGSNELVDVVRDREQILAALVNENNTSETVDEFLSESYAHELARLRKLRQLVALDRPIIRYPSSEVNSTYGHVTDLDSVDVTHTDDDVKLSGATSLMIGPP